VGEISTEAFRFLRQYIETECGISLSEDKQYLVETRLKGLMQDEGISDYMALYLRARDERNHRLRDRIIDAMTTNETLWYRGMAPFKVFSEVLLPRFEQEIREGKRRQIRIWSAACSTGQEPYSMVLAYLEYARRSTVLNETHLEVLATDISESSIKQAREGLYNSFALDRGLPEDQRLHFFLREGRHWRLDEDIRKRVNFRLFNLQDSFGALGRFDIVMARYVAIYFSDDFKRDLFAKINRTLNPGGSFFLGSSETLGSNSNNFQQQSHGRYLYYETATGAQGQASRERGLVGVGAEENRS
jgi:chemotaxis protein methyltransferase CheR